MNEIKVEDYGIGDIGPYIPSGYINPEEYLEAYEENRRRIEKSEEEWKKEQREKISLGFDNAAYIPERHYLSDVESYPVSISELAAKKMRGKIKHPGIEVMIVDDDEIKHAGGSLLGSAGHFRRGETGEGELQKYIVLNRKDDKEMPSTVAHEIGHHKTINFDEPLSISFYTKWGNSPDYNYFIKEIEAEEWAFRKTGRPISINSVTSIAAQFAYSFGETIMSMRNKIIQLFEEYGVDIDYVGSTISYGDIINSDKKYLEYVKKHKRI